MKNQIVAATVLVSGHILALDREGTLHERVRDPRVFNDGTGHEAWLWRVVPGPVLTPETKSDTS
jgi:hypothetical protein